MVVQVVFPGELLVASVALKALDPLVLGGVPLQIRLVGELHPALVADEGFDPPVAESVGVQQGLPGIGFLAELTLEGSGPHYPVLPHVVVQIALGDETLFAHLALERSQPLVYHPET